MALVDWFNNNEGFAIAALTFSLVVVTILSGRTTNAALRLARDGHELDRRVRRGANVVVRFHDGTRFQAWARGPSDATGIRLRLEVAGWSGPEHILVLLQVRPEPHDFHYQAFEDRNHVPPAAGGAIGHLVGDCTNEYGEPEPVRSAPFRVHLPGEADGNLVTFEQVT